MNIIEELKKNKIHTQIKYYGFDDLSTGISINEFISGKEIILNHYNNFNIYTIDDYIDYVYLEHILDFEETIPYIIKDKKLEFSEFISKCKYLFQNYNKSDYIKYLKNNYKNIFSYKNNDDLSCLEFDLKEYTINQMACYINGDKEIITFLIENEIYFLIDNFKNWKKFFKKNLELFKLLFSKENIEKIIYMRYQDIYNILVAFNTNDKFKIAVREISDNIYDLMVSNFFGITEGNKLWESYYILNDTICFFRKIKSGKVNLLEKEINRQKKFFDENIINEGMSVPIQIDLEPFKKMYENKEIAWEFRIVSLTHSKADDGKIKSFIDQAIEHKDKSLFSKFARNNPGTNDYFTNSRLVNLDLYTFEIKGRLNIIISSYENIKDYMDSIYEQIKYICNNIGLSAEEQQFDKDIEMLYYYLLDIKTVDFKSIRSKNLFYGLSMLLCGSIEKILREIYKSNISIDTYIPDKDITLGKLLIDHSIILKILGVNQVNCLKYLLTKIDGENDIGLNIRNDLAHLNGKTMSIISYDLVLQLLAYYTSIINTICLYYNDLVLKEKQAQET